MYAHQYLRMHLEATKNQKKMLIFMCQHEYETVIHTLSCVAKLHGNR